MQLAMFGATGGTGRLVLEKALAGGHQVKLLARNPEKLPAEMRSNPAVRVIQGDARDPLVVNQVVSGVDAVVSTLGASSPFEKSDLLGRSIPLVMAAMQQYDVRRIVVLGSGGWQPGALAKQSPIRRWLMESVAMKILKQPVESQKQQEAAILPSDRAWTIVAPPRLTNARPRGSYRVDGDALPAKASQISRADVADFIYRTLFSPEWERRRVFVSW